MICNCCNTEMGRFGFLQNKAEKIQRWRCRECKTTTTEDRRLGQVRIDESKVIQVVNFLCEGIGIRACERLAHIHRDTVMNILQFAGNRAVETFNNHLINISVKEIQIDELYSFVQKKEQNCLPFEVEHGEFYTYLAIDPITKLVVAYQVGKRNQDTTNMFISDLSVRLNKEQSFDITSDGFPCYNGPIAEHFYGNASYAQLVKNFHLLKIAKKRKEPIRCMERNIIFGNRENQSISTSFVERLNLTVRLFNKRFTRKTVCFSKSLENLRHSVALFVTYYNFCWVHSSLKVTPAMAAGIVDKKFSIADILCLKG